MLSAKKCRFPANKMAFRWCSCAILVVATFVKFTTTTPIIATSAPNTTTTTEASYSDTSRESLSVTELVLTTRNLETLPKGNPSIQTLNVAYNHIQELPHLCFSNHNFTGLRQIYLHQNVISSISVSAFKGLSLVRYVDLSDNNITGIDPYTFKSNLRLQKLILMNNNIRFDRLQTLLVSHSLEYLSLANNRIDNVYELTFLGVPNLKHLVLSGNEIPEIAPNSFKNLGKLQYLSLANTGVYQLGEQLFSHIPRTLNLEGTPLATGFEPPLTRITGESVVRLLSLSTLMTP